MKLLYVTHSFPCDLISEKSFIFTELQELRRRFDEIVLLPTDDTGRKKRYELRLPEGVKADWSLVNNRLYHSRPLKFLRYVFDPFVLETIKGMRREAKGMRQWLKGIFQAINARMASRIASKVTKTHSMTPGDTVLMSMWFHDPAMGLALLAEKEGFHMATHAHTDDIYDEMMLFRSATLRARLLNSIDKVLVISNNGREYLAAKFPQHSHRFIHHPLGSVRLNTPQTPNWQRCDDNKTDGITDEISFLTVARVDVLKRLDLTIDVVHEVAKRLGERRIKWTLIGDGPGLDTLKEKAEHLALPNLQIDFEGELENEVIQQIYAGNAPQWFLLLSESEGVPVSMGEAMSYGVPPIVTNVGDLGELIDDNSALLLPKDATAAEYADMISRIVVSPAIHHRLSLGSLAKWEKCFNGQSIARQTARILGSLIEPE